MIQSKFPAHIDGDRIQTVREHCRGTAGRAGAVLSSIKLQDSAYFAGLLHDMGKCKKEFADYLTSAASQQAMPVGSVNHSFAAVHFILESFHKTGSNLDYDDIASELLAYAVGAHHGLFDITDQDHRNGFYHRMQKDNIGYEESVQNYVSMVADKNELNQLFRRASSELQSAMGTILKMTEEKAEETADSEVQFYIGLLARLLLSAVVEGDRYDTSRFFNHEQSAAEMHTIDWDEAVQSIEGYLQGFPKSGQVNQARLSISEQCARFASEPGGIYRLNVPTGGGKTLSALRYAAVHCRDQGKQRIFYVAPLISILEQNADVIRNAIKHNDWVLEHHSNLVQEKENTETVDRFELLTQNWDCPIIVTTLVQLLNTIFSGKMSCVRRFQALTNSVLILDEVQTVPIRLLSLFNLAMNFLAEVCGTTIILCSATQPCLEQVSHSMRIQEREPVIKDESIWQCFQRTQLVDAGSMQLREVADRLIAETKNVNSVLLICNTKQEAQQVCKALKEKNTECYHISAAMCMAHRRQVLSDLYNALEKARAGQKKLVCVSTQVIEAGVDISFQTVFRLTAGIDSIVQSAGRCNRNGESKTKGKVYIVRCSDESLAKLKEIAAGKAATLALMDAYQHNPERFKNDLASDKAIEFYYKERYAKCQGYEQDGYVESIHKTLYELLSKGFAEEMGSLNTDTIQVYMEHAFKTAGKFFKVLDQDNVDVLVPYKKGIEIQEKLTKVTADRMQEIHRLLTEAKPYCVSLTRIQAEGLEKNGMLIPLLDRRILVLNKECYNDVTGVQTSFPR